MKEKLNKCPHCGSNEIVTEVNLEFDCASGKFPQYETCCDCLLTSPDSTSAELVKRWNSISLDKSITETETLQDCPSCGSKDIIAGHGDVYCNKCGLKAPDDGLFGVDNMKEIRLFWNQLRVGLKYKEMD